MERIKCRMKALDQRLTQVKKKLGKLISQWSPECQPDNLEPSLNKIDLFISQIFEEIVAAAQTQEDENKAFKLAQNQKLIRECYDKRAIILLEQIPTFEDPPLDYSEELPTAMSPNSGSLQADLNYVHVKNEIPCSSWNLEENPAQNDEIPSSNHSEDCNILIQAPPRLNRKRKGRGRPKLDPSQRKPPTKRIRIRKPPPPPPRDPTKYMYCSIEGCNARFLLDQVVSFEFHKLWHQEPSLASYKHRSGKCPICPKTYSKILATPLHYHILSEHFNIQILPFPCSIPGCDRKFMSPGHANLHEKSHAIGSHPCPECDMICTSEMNLSAHKRKNHGPLKCPICPRTFAVSQARTNHIKEHKITIVCEHCGKSMPKSTHLNHLRKVHGSFKCKIGDCSEAFVSRDKRREHWKSSHTRQFICDQCTKSYYSLVDLSTHMRLHELSLVCNWEGCGRSYPPDLRTIFERHVESHKKDLEAQKKLRDSASRTYDCDLCGRVYPIPQSLVYHKQTFHVETPQFLCDVEGCGKAFKVEKGLRKHKLLHNMAEGECEFCHKTYDTPMRLKDHRYKVHRKELSLGFNCEICGMSYKIKGFLDIHMEKEHGKN